MQPINYGTPINEENIGHRPGRPLKRDISSVSSRILQCLVAYKSIQLVFILNTILCALKLNMSSAILYLAFGCILVMAGTTPQIPSGSVQPPRGPAAAIGVQFLPSPQISPPPPPNSGLLDIAGIGVSSLLDLLFRVVG